VIVNNSTNINKTKESLNSDVQQFYQYQQNKQQPVTSNKWTQNRTWDVVGNADPGLWQAQKCGGVKVLLTTSLVTTS